MKARSCIALGMVALMLAACATPVAPTGGPVDQTPPRIAESEPETNTVNFSGTELSMTFNEYVDQASFQQALSITPAFEGRPRIGWRGRRVKIVFPEALRDSTTYLFTLDTGLRDVHGVALKRPVTLAFATGPEIDRGELSGVVQDPLTNQGVEGYDVFAFAVADTALPAPGAEAPDYRTQTDDSGRFTFSYLADRPFFVVAVEDRNRNRRLDDGETFAVPPVRSLRPVEADSAQTDSLALDVSASPERLWYLTRLDTTAPDLQRIRVLSSRRLQLRFDESVRLTSVDPAQWTLADTLGTERDGIRSVYIQPREPRFVYIVTDSLPEQPFRLQATALTDSIGNPWRGGDEVFTPTARPDTFRLRFTGFLPEQPLQRTDSLITLRPDERPGVAFSEPVSESRLSSMVTVQDTAGQAISVTPETANGVQYTFPIDQPIQISVNGASLGVDTMYTTRFQVVPESERGELAGVVDISEPPVVVELFTAETPPVRVATAQPDEAGRFLFRDVPAGTYRTRAFIDRDSSGTWTAGRLRPYEPYEPLTWSSDSVAARIRWEVPFPDTLRFSDFPSN